MVESSHFLGRSEELKQLNHLAQKKQASFVVINGRRRIGKSRLVREFAKDKPFYRFAGLAPDGVQPAAAEDQRLEFAERLNHYGIATRQTDDWNPLFRNLASAAKHRPGVILFDEISWMAAGDPLFLPKLKNAWDFYFSEIPGCILILCGSVSTWIEDNILSSTGFYGRITLQITLNELSLYHSNALLKEVGFSRSPMEQFIILSLTGGVPWYLEQVDPKRSALDNINQLCFSKQGVFVREFTRIFNDLFAWRGDIYHSIVTQLAKKPSEYNQLTESLSYHRSGSLSKYLQQLITAGFVRRDYTWHIATGKPARLSHFRLKDNYLRFYLRYIEPKLTQIEQDLFAEKPFMDMPGVSGILGLQLENLVLNNRAKIHQLLGINPKEIVSANPFFQRQTKIRPGCQIDYLIQTELGTLFACEIKFSKDKLDMSIVRDMQQKLGRLKLPKQFACVPVLIHVNGVTDAVAQSNYFASIIDFTDMLESL